MPNFAYNRGLPNGPDNPSNDQPGMQINTNSSEDIWDVDHFGFNDNQGGYHDIIHQPPVLVDPTPIAGIQQIYVKNSTVNTVTDTQLFSITGLGVISQLTGSSSTTNGYQRIGGVTIQWGTVANPGSSGSVSFSAPTFFFNNIFNIQLTLNRPASGNAISAWVTEFNTAGFQYASNFGSSTNLFWVAIGN